VTNVDRRFGSGGVDAVYSRPALRVNARAGSTYALQSIDAVNTLVTMDHTGANTLVLPRNDVVPIKVGSVVTVEQIGAGRTTIVGASGVSANAADDARSCRVRYSMISVVKTATNSWTIFGDTGV
jgi:hypothetical protein